MPAVEVIDVVKTYGDKKVVDQISFSVDQSQILGLIGPNGAGKTTTIRMMMDIIKPDAGEVRILGQKFNEDSKNLIGYLPEERGMYRKMRVLETLIYFASLKGMKTAYAKLKAEQLLDRVNMRMHQNRKIEELSHGMAQLIQLLSTIIHDPKLLIFDEPFSGLDPVNVKMVKDIIKDLRKQGKALILSTHRMNEIEEICDSIFMINKGRSVLYGRLDEVKRRFRRNSVIIDFDGELGRLEGAASMKVNGNTTEVTLNAGVNPSQILKQLAIQKIIVNRFEVATPSLNEIFLRIAGEN